MAAGTEADQDGGGRGPAAVARRGARERCCARFVSCESASHTTPTLIERDGPSGLLDAALADAWAGRGRVALVSGEAGIGKTALVEDFIARSGARVLVGHCDDLAVPRPLGAVRDVAREAGGELGDAVASDAPVARVHDLLVHELGRGPGATVLVVEDLHWADEATLDAVSVVGRRVTRLNALLVVTHRPWEATGARAPAAVVGAFPPDATVHVALEPLSADAVSALSGGRPDASAIHARTGGNPFYVTELLRQVDDATVPHLVSASIAGRSARLPAESQRLLETVAVVPGRVEVALLHSILPGWREAAEAPERQGLLSVAAGHVAFRHELARVAMAESLSPPARQARHADVVRALVAHGGDPADVVHHAAAAGDEDTVVAHVVDAARRAAALGAHREAYAHYQRVADLLERFPAPERATLLEEFGFVAYVVDRLDEAFEAVRRAISLSDATGDVEGVGRATRVLARLHWWNGDSPAARREAHESVSLLEPLGPSPLLARAYGEVAQLAQLSHDLPATMEWGARAVEMADRVDATATRIHAMVSMGTAHMGADVDDRDLLHAAHALADSHGDFHEATRAISNLAYNLVCAARGDEAAAAVERAYGYARSHEIHNMAAYDLLLRSWLLMRRGEWDEACGLVEAERPRLRGVVLLVKDSLLAEHAVRRGEADAADRLADVVRRSTATGELQRIIPVLELSVEHAVVNGLPPPVTSVKEAIDLVGRHEGAGWPRDRIAAVAAIAGVQSGLAATPGTVFADIAARRWADAAAGFDAIGYRHDAALMRILSDIPSEWERALHDARRCGGTPVERRAAALMRGAGLRIPRGPRAPARANAAGLTARQQEVLALLVDGASNTDIARDLVLSVRTAEHHVAAVLGKIGASSRREAAARAATLGLAPTGDLTP